MRFLLKLVPLAVLWCLPIASPAQDTDPRDGSVLPRPPVEHDGKLAPSVEESTPFFPPRAIEAPEQAPNIILVMTDDVGFGSVSTFGGSVPKPHLDELAGNGLTYNRFHTTGICSPTRAALLTGRNHHSVGTGALVEMDSPYPGYTGLIPPDAATVARILRDNGYNTAMFGKDHNVPHEHRSPAGPFDQWPTGRGFEHFYGFVSGDANQFDPALYRGTSPVDSAHREEDFILDRAMTDEAIRWVHNQKAAAPDKPFFMYYAPGTAHAPQQVPREWIEKFEGRFDHGWDRERERILERQKAMGIVPQDTQLAPRPEPIPAWDSLSEKEQQVHARFMEVYTAMLAYQDAQFGRLMDELERMGIADNTLVVYIEGDNGSAAEVGIHGALNELPAITAPQAGRHYDLDWLANNLDVMGGPDTYQAMPAGWSFAMSTPFPWVKQVASHLGGTRNGMVISWPDGIEREGGIRNQYHHVIDVMPTLLEAANVQVPEKVDGVEQQPVDGKSMVYSFDNGDAEPVRTTQYYEVVGNRGIYHEGWQANTTPRNMPWDISRAGEGSDISTYEWELYNLREDFSQSRDLARERPDKLREMRRLFAQQAREHNVYPIQNTGAMARARASGQGDGPRLEHTYWGPDIHLPSGVAPSIFWIPFSLEARIDIPEGGAEGVIAAAGSRFGGWSFYLDEGRPVAAASTSAQPGGFHRLAADDPLAPGSRVVTFDVAFTREGAKPVIRVDGEEVARGAFDARPLTMAGGGETFDTGRDTNAPVSPDYDGEGVFSGSIDSIRVQLKPPRGDVSQ